MVRLAPFLLSVLSSGVGAFQVPSVLSSGASTSVTWYAKFEGNERQTRFTLPAFQEGSQLRLSFSKDDDDTGLADEIELLGADLASEIEEALSLAQDALAVDVSPDDKDIDDIAEMLMEKPPPPPPPPPTQPAPPKEDPPASVVSLSLEEDADENVPLPPESPPPVAAVDFGQTLQKKIESLKNLMLGLTEELEKTEVVTEEAESSIESLKREMQDSITERKGMVKRIEIEFANEQELLVTQMGIASDQLQAVMDESAHNIKEAKSKATRAEKELISRIDSLKTAIAEVTASSVEVQVEKERIQRSKQSILEKVLLEGKKKMGQFKRSLQFDLTYAKQRNADLARRADEVESKVRGIYDQINGMRTEKNSLQQQIIDVEKDALEEIETLQCELRLDDARYKTTLSEERHRMDTIIDEKYKAYSVKVCNKTAERQSADADYKEKLRIMSLKITDEKEKEKTRVKIYLDKLEEKHKKERIVVYQEKFEAVSAVRKQMNEDLAIEYGEIEETHKTMIPKIDSVTEQTARLKADFEEEMAKKRQLTKEVEEDILHEISHVRVDMTDKMKTVRRLNKENCDSLSADMNLQISESEVELRQRWRELATTKMLLTEVRDGRDKMIDDVTGKQSLIDSFEIDRNSFRTSLRLTARVAREKIGSKKRSLLKKVKKKTH